MDSELLTFVTFSNFKLFTFQRGRCGFVTGRESCDVWDVFGRTLVGRYLVGRSLRAGLSCNVWNGYWPVSRSLAGASLAGLCRTDC